MLPDSLASSASLLEVDVSVNQLDALPAVYITTSPGLDSSPLQYVALDYNNFQVIGMLWNRQNHISAAVSTHTSPHERCADEVLAGPGTQKLMMRPVLHCWLQGPFPAGFSTVPNLTVFYMDHNNFR